MTTNIPQHNLTPQQLPIESLRSLGRDSLDHPKQQIEKLATNLSLFGFVIPIVVDDQNRIVAGTALVEAAKHLLLTHVPAIQLKELSEAKLRLLRISLNRIAEDSSWNPDELKLEFQEILSMDASLDLTTSGFEMGEIDLIFMDDDPGTEEPSVALPNPEQNAATQTGDLWQLGSHRLLCADALEKNSYVQLLGSTRARTVFTDPPYNVRIQGNVCGKGSISHNEFAMASGEMTEAEFIEFLSKFIALATQFSQDGALHYVCMDWRHLYELESAARPIYSEQKNLCVWNKTNAGMGSLYRSKHELVAVYKVGASAHINNVELGKHGRHRSNVWDYAGVNTFRPGRIDDLEAHPTVKPLALVADALLDSTNRGDAVLDPFLGSGTTLLACEQTNRTGYGIEIDPLYVDVAIQRWQEMTGEAARHATTNQTFEAIREQRCTSSQVANLEQENTHGQ